MTGLHVSKVSSEKDVLIRSSAVEGGSESLGFDSMSFGGNASGGNTRGLPGRGMVNVRKSLGDGNEFGPEPGTPHRWIKVSGWERSVGAAERIQDV
jgi:hypothetical protein